jgi:hypothetical protein
MEITVRGCNYRYELTGFTCLMTRDHGALRVAKTAVRSSFPPELYELEEELSSVPHDAISWR